MKSDNRVKIVDKKQECMCAGLYIACVSCQVMTGD